MEAIEDKIGCGQAEELIEQVILRHHPRVGKLILKSLISSDTIQLQNC